MTSLKSSVRRLRAGIVPSQHIEELSVGYDSVRELLLSRLADLETGRPISPLLVQGEWGSGKSHLLEYARAACHALRVAHACVSIDARSHALNYPQYFYPVLARSLECELGTGVHEIARTCLEGPQAERLRDFVRTSPRSPFTNALLELSLNREREKSLSLIDHPAWTTLGGEDLSFADYSYLRDKALVRLQELAEFSRTLGFGGIVLLFDEAETVDQLWNVRSRMGAYRVFGALCQMRHVWCIFAITKRFRRTVENDIGNGILTRSRLSQEARAFLHAWRTQSLDILQPPTMRPSMATDLVERMISVYSRAHGTNSQSRERLNVCLRDWEANPSANPRTLIRSIIQQLDVGRNLRASFLDDGL